MVDYLYCRLVTHLRSSADLVLTMASLSSPGVSALLHTRLSLRLGWDPELEHGADWSVSHIMFLTSWRYLVVSQVKLSHLRLSLSVDQS